MIALLRMICVAAALYLVALYFTGSSNDVVRQMGKLKELITLALGKRIK